MFLLENIKNRIVYNFLKSRNACDSRCLYIRLIMCSELFHGISWFSIKCSMGKV